MHIARDVRILLAAGVLCFAYGFYQLKQSNQKPTSASGDLKPLIWFVLGLILIAYVGVAILVR
jgi:hypothetical protein